MNISKRVLTLALTLLLTLTLVPSVSFAGEPDTSTDEQSAGGNSLGTEYSSHSSSQDSQNLALTTPALTPEENDLAAASESEELQTAAGIAEVYDYKVTRNSEVEATVDLTFGTSTGTFYHVLDGFPPSADWLVNNKENETPINDFYHTVTLDKLTAGEHLLYVVVELNNYTGYVATIPIPEYDYGLKHLRNPKYALSQVLENGFKQKILFETGHDKVTNPVSHAQGYARYRGEGYDFHVFPYSNVAGSFGRIYIASNAIDGFGKSKQQFTIEIPQPSIRHSEVATGTTASYDPHFNHPCGVQIIDDYLVLSVIPFETANSRFYDSAIVYLYDLSPLKNPTPEKPTLVRELMRIPKVNGLSLSCVGITKVKDNIFALGLISDNNLDVYLSIGVTSLWDSQWGGTPDYRYELEASSGGNHYQGMGFLLDENNDVFMLAFDTRGGISNKDYADLYQLTSSWRWPQSGSTLNPLYEKHLTGYEGARFTYGGGVELDEFGALIIYSVAQNYDEGGIWINYFQKSPVPQASLDRPGTSNTGTTGSQPSSASNPSSGNLIPQTGDGNALLVYSLILVSFSLIGIACISYTRRFIRTKLLFPRTLFD